MVTVGLVSDKCLSRFNDHVWVPCLRSDNISIINTAQIDMRLEINESASGHMSCYTRLLIKTLIYYHVDYWITEQINGIVSSVFRVRLKLLETECLVGLVQGVSSCEWLIPSSAGCLILWVTDPIKCRVSHPVSDWSHQGVSSCEWLILWGSGCLNLWVTDPMRFRVSHPVSDWSYEVQGVSTCEWLILWGSGCLILWVTDPISAGYLVL